MSSAGNEYLAQELTKGDAAPSKPLVTWRDLPAYTPGAKFSPPDLGNMTPERIVDEIGNIRKWKSLCEAADKFFSTALKARIKFDALSATGEIYHMSLSGSERTTISPDLCRQYLDEETLAKVTVTTPVVTMRFDFK